MASPAPAASRLRWVPGEVVVKSTTARLVVPSAGISSWPPMSRAVETLATQTRQLPAHSHEREEVLTYVVEGFASYQYESQPAVAMPAGSVRLLSATTKVSHRVSPARGGSIRWFSLVSGLPASADGAPSSQASQPRESELQPDGTVSRTLVGPGSGINSKGNLQAREVRFVTAGTIFQAVGHARRGLVYAFSGRGEIDSQPIEGGEAVLIEGASGIALHGQPGLRLLVASAPVPA